MIKKSIHNTMSTDDKLKALDNIQISTPDTARVTKAIAQHINTCSKKKKANALVINGPSCTGKTTIVKSYIKGEKYTGKKNAKSQKSIYINLTHPSTLKSLIDDLLTQLGIFNLRRPIAATTSLLINELSRANIKCIYLDNCEAFSGASVKEIQYITHWIRNTSEKAQVPVVFIGRQPLAKIFNKSPQISRFISNIVDIKPMNWYYFGDRKKFCKILDVIDQALPFPQSSNLADKNTARAIYRSTEGVIGHVIDLVCQAGKLAIERNYKCIGMPVLEKAHDRNAFPAHDTINPFSSSHTTLQNRQLFNMRPFISKISRIVRSYRSQIQS